MQKCSSQTFLEPVFHAVSKNRIFFLRFFLFSGYFVAPFWTFPGFPFNFHSLCITHHHTTMSRQLCVPIKALVASFHLVLLCCIDRGCRGDINQVVPFTKIQMMSHHWGGGVGSKTYICIYIFPDRGRIRFPKYGLGQEKSIVDSEPTLIFLLRTKARKYTFFNGIAKTCAHAFV